MRRSHLYRFGVVMTAIAREEALCGASRAAFSPARGAVDLAGDPRFRAMVSELPEQFNACYLTMIAWLSRLYDVEAWASDRRP